MCGGCSLSVCMCCFLCLAVARSANEAGNYTTASSSRNSCKNCLYPSVAHYSSGFLLPSVFHFLSHFHPLFSYFFFRFFYVLYISRTRMLMLITKPEVSERKNDWVKEKKKNNVKCRYMQIYLFYFFS